MEESGVVFHLFTLKQFLSRRRILVARWDRVYSQNGYVRLHFCGDKTAGVIEHVVQTIYSHGTNYRKFLETRQSIAALLRSDIRLK